MFSFHYNNLVPFEFLNYTFTPDLLYFPKLLSKGKVVYSDILPNILLYKQIRI
jgi:hypothetical protein